MQGLNSNETALPKAQDAAVAQARFALSIGVQQFTGRAQREHTEGRHPLRQPAQRSISLGETDPLIQLASPADVRIQPLQ